MPLLETEEEAAENIANIYERRDDTRKKEYGIDVNGLERDGYNINGIDKSGTVRDGYNINGVDINGVDKDGLNINGIKGTRKKYPKKILNIKKMIMVFYMISMGLIQLDLIKMVIIYMDLI